MPTLRFQILSTLGMALLLFGMALPARAQSKIRFDRDIRPILADRCYSCHGPDRKANRGSLRLHRREDLFEKREGYHIVLPGDPAKSELFRRLTATDLKERMPPPRSGKQLSGKEVALIKKWIATGAPYQSHWAFVPPRRPDLPQRGSHSWPRNPIDSFTLARLEKEKLSPSPEADKSTLLRRVTLDLTGLPPTPAELDAFLADDSPDAYEKVAERLLASPHYGERMALPWLDLARYADTHGYLFDTARSMWRWREWVIEALNHNMPYDRFTIEQLAGDLLPNPTLPQRIATGFNRNHIINNEAGAIPQEYFVENVVDRTDTTATVWLGLTLTCARCHDHKYDPISQKEYYQLYAFFNNIPERGLDGLNKNAVPLLKAPTVQEQRHLKDLDKQLSQADASLRELKPKIDAAQKKWEKSCREPFKPNRDGLIAHWPLDDNLEDTTDPGHHASFKADVEEHAEGVLGSAVSFNGLRYLDAGKLPRFDRDKPFTLSLWAYPTVPAGRQSFISCMTDAKKLYNGYTLQMVEGSVVLYLIHRFADNMIQVQTKAKLEPEQWHHIVATYNGSGKAKGVALYLNGKKQPTLTPADTLTGSFATQEPFHIGNGHPNAKFKGLIDEVRVYSRPLTSEEVSQLPGLSIPSLLQAPAEKRTKEQARRIQDIFLKDHAPKTWRHAYQHLSQLQGEKKKSLKNISTVMVMQEQKKQRETFILVRGAYDKRGEKVTMSTPSILPPLDKKLPRNRLGLAQWLTQGNHPLTARVAVNRFWQLFFGKGLVGTSDDFGHQGEPPSHPLLLDWLATEFVRSEWDIKSLHRLIVTSATYRQSSHASESMRAKDPENRLLARGPAVRLSAELIRDQALSISGLLVDRIGGPSVKPYQPNGLWKEGAFDPSGAALTAQVYQQDQGAKLYRRGLYTFWKRTAPPPSLLLFDAPDRERCVVRRSRTNTPLQALALMNDPTYVEAARKLAERMMKEASPADRIAYGFRLATARYPKDREQALFRQFFEQQKKRYLMDTKAAKQLLQVGESPYDIGLPVADLAAWTLIANAILNLDEVITKR